MNVELRFVGYLVNLQFLLLTEIQQNMAETVLQHPEKYIGSIKKHTQTLWVYENGEMVFRPISFVPGLYEIFNGVLMNAVESRQRDDRMNSLKVVIDVEQNQISVYNSGGVAIPVEEHEETGVYVPEMIFGNLLTSDDGHVGVAKLANIFSTELIIETAGSSRLKPLKYKQV